MRCRRHHSLQSRLGPCSPTPSRPAASNGCMNRPDRRLHPTNAPEQRITSCNAGPSAEDIGALVNQTHPSRIGGRQHLYCAIQETRIAPYVLLLRGIVVDRARPRQALKFAMHPPKLQDILLRNLGLPFLRRRSHGLDCTRSVMCSCVSVGESAYPKQVKRNFWPSSAV